MSSKSLLAVTFICLTYREPGHLFQAWLWVFLKLVERLTWTIHMTCCFSTWFSLSELLASF
ncbi:hypothetical protein KC19_VG082500 [Ceratodon purpureus]|uniref:Uncharacterized protein n=1 Tax=Ceratodon purpureus TaxID=3225 RepID=A0A8T0HNW5_CERPU|nr:hypothetical protein KC19_VG082500 [Ceratodon purpureus]